MFKKRIHIDLKRSLGKRAAHGAGETRTTKGGPEPDRAVKPCTALKTQNLSVCESAAILRLGVASPINPQAFGNEIARIRRSKGIRQKEVPGRISTYYSDDRAYRRIESGDRLPDRDAAIAIVATALQVTDIPEINRLLSVAGYAPLTSTEIQLLGLMSVERSQIGPKPSNAFLEGLTGTFSTKSRAIALALVTVAVFCVVAMSSAHAVFTIITALLYASLYPVSLLLETTLDIPRPAIRPMAAVIFGFMAISSVLALRLDAWLAGAGSGNPLLLVAPLGVFFGAAAAQWLILKPLLSETAVVPLTFQAHTAQAAHLKNSLYYLVAVILFWLLPYHCITILEREARAGHVSWVKAVTRPGLIVGKDLVAFRPEWLWGAFLLILLLMIPMAARLFENLRGHPARNTYSMFVYLRAIIYSLLILFCLLWYSAKIGALTAGG